MWLFTRSLLPLAALLAAAVAVSINSCRVEKIGDTSLSGGKTETMLSQTKKIANDNEVKRIYFRNACVPPTTRVGIWIYACNEREDGPLPNIITSKNNLESVDVVCDEYACPDGVHMVVFDVCRED